MPISFVTGLLGGVTWIVIDYSLFNTSIKHWIQLYIEMGGVDVVR